MRRGFDAGLVRSPYPFATLCGSRDNAISEGGTCNIDECGWCCRARDGACTICHFGKLSPRIGLPLSHSCSPPPRELSRSSIKLGAVHTYMYICFFLRCFHKHKSKPDELLFFFFACLLFSDFMLPKVLGRKTPKSIISSDPASESDF